ncbi:MAG: hypothetical protein QME12_06990 [Nanoarchaeota archaeon]|nr:hypothetical protein [Nanoarchaeota archaeon]
MGEYEKIVLESMFWTGFAIILLPVFYPQLMFFAIIVSFALMFFTVAKEGFSLAKGRTFMETVKKNEIPLLHKCLAAIAIILAAVYIYFDGDAAYNSLQNFLAWLVSASSVSALALIAMGVIFASLVLFEPSRRFLRKVGILRKKEKRMLRLWMRITKRKWRTSGYYWSNFSFAKMFRHGKKKKPRKKGKILVRAPMASAEKLLASAFILVITIILILNNKGIFSSQKPMHLAILIGLFVLFAALAGFSSYSNAMHPGKEHGKPDIKPAAREKIVQAVAKAGKYETDIDRLYKTIGKAEVINITQAAAMFRITKEQAEEWGKILESHGLIELNYPALGELQLCKKKLKPTE